MRRIVFITLSALLAPSCTLPPAPQNTCLSFAVLDTKVEGNVVYETGPVPVLEILPITRADILSAEFRRDRIPDSIPKSYYDGSITHFNIVELLLSEASSETLRRASEEHRLKKLRISRESYEPFEAGMVATLAGRRIDIQVDSEARGRQLVELLTMPCE